MTPKIKKILIVDKDFLMEQSKNNFKKLYDRCGGHFDIKGETLISNVIKEYIVEKNLLKK